MNKTHGGLIAGTVLWFCAIFWLASRGVFESGPNQPPVAVAVAFVTPLLLFMVTVRMFSGWRARVLSLPPILLIAMNGWRFIGLGFLMAWAEGLLPGGFAWPAGLGDIFMAATAPFVAARVASDDRFRLSGGFVAWNLLGIADFLDAVFLGTLYLWPGFARSVNTGLMQRLPFALIPCFFVPLIAMAHMTLLMQRRRDTQSPLAV